MVKYSDKLADKICNEIANGKSLRKIAKMKDMPTVSGIMKWLGQTDKSYFVEQYAHAREAQADYYADSIIDIAQECPKVSEAVQRAKLEIDAIKWVAGKLKPKKYGDKILHGGDESMPLKHEFTVKYVESTTTPNGDTTT